MLKIQSRIEKGMDVKKNNYDPEGGKFQYWVGFKTDAGDEDVQARIAVEVALSVSENGDLADLSFTVPKACRNEHAMTFLQKHAAKGQVVTGLLYVDPDSEDLHTHLDTVETPLNTLEAKDLCPGTSALEKINASLR